MGPRRTQKMNFWGHLGSFWGHLGVFWGSFGAHLGSLYESNVFAQICPNLGHFGSLWAILIDNISDPRAELFGLILGSFWAHFGVI